VIAVSALAVTGIAAWDLNRQIKTVHLAGEDRSGNTPEISAIDGGVNLLLVGSDSRANAKYSYGEDPGSELNDVNILLHVSEDHTNAVAISFPRDLYVPIPECPDGNGGTTSAMTSEKINTALLTGGGSANGGLACVVLTVESLTGLTIPFAAEISFDGVIEMSNAIGGVPVCVAQPIQDDHTQLYLDAGVHDLKGMDALKFLRTRYGVGNGSDITRISSQQVFLSSLVRKVKSADTLTDISKLYGLAGAAVRNMTFSNSLNNIDTMVQIAKALAPIDLGKMVFVQYPSVDSYDGSGLETNQASADALMQAVLADKPIGLTTNPDENQGSVAAPGTEETPAPTGTDPSATPEPGATTSPDGVVQLPADVLGQTSAQETCTVGRSLQDQ
jgi:LCP family protein required for cell wall assembly